MKYGFLIYTLLNLPPHHNLRTQPKAMRRRLRTTGIKREQKTNTEKHANKQKIIIK